MRRRSRYHATVSSVPPYEGDQHSIDRLTDVLEAAIDHNNVYEPVRPVLFAAIRESRSPGVIDICSGAVGPWLSWSRRGLLEFEVILTVDELKAMADDSDYEWRCGTVQGSRWPLPITYFVGLPRH